MRKKLLAGLAAVALAAGSANAALVYGVDEFDNLVTFNSSSPGTTLSSVALTGLQGTLFAIDFRPATRDLYGLDDSGRLYTIDTGTGVATAVGPDNPLLSGGSFSFDFNPTIDRIRVVTNTNQNNVYNPDTGLATIATPVFYAAGDPNFGLDPDVTASAYTNSFPGATTSQLYSIDTLLNVLARQANSAGTLNTVGPLGVNLGARTSFDIGPGNIGYVQDNNRFYTIDLNTGALSFVGNTDTTLYGIAVAIVPEASTWAMMIGGFGLVGGALRRRSRRERLAAA